MYIVCMHFNMELVTTFYDETGIHRLILSAEQWLIQHVWPLPSAHSHIRALNLNHYCVRNTNNGARPTAARHYLVLRRYIKLMKILTGLRMSSETWTWTLRQLQTLLIFIIIIFSNPYTARDTRIPHSIIIQHFT